MDNDKIQELLHVRATAEKELEKMRTPITILFSDIKGSTAYFEQKGDVEGLVMVQRHNNLLIPVIEKGGGRVVKTIGDAIMASFNDPVGAVRAAVGMQQALEDDRSGRKNEEQIHIRVGLHTGLGLLKDNDVFGDVVNVASRVQHQAEPSQILITDVLLEAAKTAGVQCAKMGRAEMRGKDEPIDLYAVAWSSSASEQLVEELQAQFEKRLKDAKRQQDLLEEELEAAREQWRVERRRMNAEMEELEEEVERAKESAQEQVSEDLQSEIKFRLEEALKARQLLEQEFAALQTRSEAEKNNLKAQIASMQGAVIEAMEKSNNPTRVALAVREQLDARVKEARQDWELQWEGERRRMAAEIERLKKSGGLDERKEAARRALLVKLGKAPAGSSGPAPKSTYQIEKEFQDAKIQWEVEREQLNLKIRRLERDIEHGKDEIRNDAFQEIRSRYEAKIVEATQVRQQLERELQSLTDQSNAEREQASERIAQLERALPQGQEAAKRQVTAELNAEFELQLEELNRLKARNERRFQDEAEEAEADRRRLRKQVEELEEQLKEAKEAVYRALRSQPYRSE